MTDWQGTKQRIARYYTDRIAKYGSDHRACDFGHPGSQQLKYQVLSDVMPLEGKSVLDVGCGFADFSDFLNTRYRAVRYTGVDITRACVEGAQALRPGVDIRLLDILDDDPGGPYDLVTANGIFYLIGGDAEARMRAIVTRMYALCSGAVAFNSLSSWCADSTEGEFYADPLSTLDFCRQLTPWVCLRHDYHPRDFTVFLYREQPS